ncbi:hypothetical protein, partial [Nitrosomonas sp. ANs5]|uniref:hypothetical protein n=1 Tax=Nitrosomonas sp. ANs5 TaxID=3423941 RepID=UPI003D3578BE
NGNSAEIRAVLRGMTEKKRYELINDAIENRDGEILHAVLGSHPSLSGLTKANLDALWHQATRKHAPELLELKKGIEKGITRAKTAFIHFMEHDDAMTAAEVRQRYAKQQELADAAREKLNQI